MEPKVSLEGGYGIDRLASVGAKGTLAFPTKLVPFSEMGIDLRASASVHLYCLYCVDIDYTLAKIEVPLFHPLATPSTKAELEQRLPGGGYTVIEKKSMIDTSYTEKTTDWNTSVLEAPALSTLPFIPILPSPSTDMDVVLQQSVLKTSKPQIAKAGNKTVMIYQNIASDTGGVQTGRTQLMYSVYSFGSWSEPQPVWKDASQDTADLDASLLTIDNTLYVGVKEREAVQASQADPMDNHDTVATYQQFKISPLTGISAEKTKKTYQTGEILNLDDLFVTASYADDSTETITGYTINAASIDMSTAGNKMLEIVYTCFKIVFLQ